MRRARGMGQDRRIVLTLLAGLMVVLALGLSASPASANHCDQNNDPNCGPHVPDPPPPVDPPCNGSVGPVHAWPCAVDQSIDCTQAATSPSSCSAVQVTVYPTTAGPVTVNGASTAPVNVPIPNAYSPAGPTVVMARDQVSWAVSCVKNQFDPILCFHGGP